MTKEEMIKQITSTPKWYSGFWSQQTASAMVKRFWKGSLSDKKFKEIVAKMSYKETSPAQYDVVVFKSEK